MKQIKKVSEKDYCYHVSVIEYALYTEKGKAVVKKTSEISKIAGVSKRTLQYYDDEGMIQVKRSENNYRLYDERALGTLWKIMLYKETGMELKEIKKVLSMSEGEKKEKLPGRKTAILQTTKMETLWKTGRIKRCQRNQI